MARSARLGRYQPALPFALEASAVSAVGFFSFLIERPENDPGQRDGAQEKTRRPGQSRSQSPPARV